MTRSLSVISKRRPPAALIAATAVAVAGVGTLAITQPTTQSGTNRVPNRSPQRELRVPSSFSSASSASSPIWTLITLTGFDADGGVVEQHLDFHPLARFDLFGGGPGDLNFDGVVDLADLNILLPLIGTDYTEATAP